MCLRTPTIVGALGWGKPKMAVYVPMHELLEIDDSPARRLRLKEPGVEVQSDAPTAVVA
jgi:hypothetical protein